MKLSDQVVALTGGAGVLGRLLVNRLHCKVKRLIVLDRDEEGMSRLSEEYPDIHGYRCDLGDHEAVIKTVDRIYADDHEITVLVNGAGYIHSEPLINLMSREQKRHNAENWVRVINDNLNSVFFVTSCVVERMVASRTKGLIVNVSSISASGNIGQSAYGAAKAGVNTLATIWSKELGVFGIRAVSIAPGFLDVASTHNALNESTLKGWVRRTPLNRLGSADELLSALEFVIENDFFNGRVLEIDGGLRI